VNSNQTVAHGSCAQCGWPVCDAGPWRASAHPTSDGTLRYLRCVCGAWLVLLDGGIIGQTATTCADQGEVRVL
jgi:hypothetical protein